MSDYLATQKTISAAFDSALEVMTPQGEKIQFNSSGTLLLQRPNEIRLTRTGGYADVELLLDGKTATLYGKNLNSYVQLDGDQLGRPVDRHFARPWNVNTGSRPVARQCLRDVER